MSHPIGFADYRSVVDYDIDRLGVEAYEWLLFSTSIVNRLVRSHGFVFFRIPFFLLVCWRIECTVCPILVHKSTILETGDQVTLNS